MNDKTKPGKFRGLSIAALCMGLLSVVSMPLVFSASLPFNILNLQTLLTKFAIVFILTICFPLAAIICGSVDLKRIKAGRYSNKGKGLSIAGIVLGSVFLIPGLILFAAEIIANTSAINDFIFKYEQMPSS